MMRPILVTILCLVASAQSQTGNCQLGEGREVKKCFSEAGPCDIIETAIRCFKSTHENCAPPDAYLVVGLILDLGRFDNFPNEPCFQQQFDEFFNKDGLCSFQDAKDMVKCFQDPKNDQNMDKNRDDFDSHSDDPHDYHLCKDLQLIEMCIKEVRESCVGFAQRQLKSMVDYNLVQNQRGEIPQCVKSMLAGEKEDKFPVFNKFVDDIKKLEDELALIKELVNNQ